MEWLYAPAKVWHVAVLGLFLATWLYAINRGLVMIAKGVIRIGQRFEPELFGAEETAQRYDDTHLR
jgi:hypothetical protein